MAASPDAVEAAPAKVNLFLHVRGRRPDGYHLLESLAVFPAVGDLLSATPAADISLEVAGRFAAALSSGEENLVLRAARALAAAAGVTRGAAISLDKSLPVSSGIGGGSADAAAALRLLARVWNVHVPGGVASGLGADVPVCLSAPEPRFMAGTGEHLSSPPPLPAFWMVLVNPGVPVGTGPVFAALDRADGSPCPVMPAGGFCAFGDLAGWLARQRNDLAPAAMTLCPAIGEVLDALSDAALARMSGSGATCFALHEGRASAEAQAGRIRRERPGWWVAAAPVAPWPGAV